VNAALERVLTWALALALVAALVGVVAIAVNPPQTTEPYTEFYVLGPDGSASDYPENLSVDESGTVTVGVANFERQRTSYVVVARLGDRQVLDRSLTLAIEERREFPVTFTPREAGQVSLRLALYRGDSTPTPSTEPYRQLRVVVNVTARS